MERIEFAQFGPTTRFDAAHIVDDSGRVGASVAEPEARRTAGWNEVAFREAVEAEVSSWEARNEGDWLWIQYDPGRDQSTSVKVELRG